MSTVVMDRLETALADGITDATLPLLDAAYGEGGAGSKGLEEPKGRGCSCTAASRIG